MNKFSLLEKNETKQNKNKHKKNLFRFKVSGKTIWSHPQNIIIYVNYSEFFSFFFTKRYVIWAIIKKKKKENIPMRINRRRGPPLALNT